jgi:hypothetical protein
MTAVLSNWQVAVPYVVTATPCPVVWLVEAIPMIPVNWLVDAVTLRATPLALTSTCSVF